MADRSLPEHPEKDWNEQAVYQHVGGAKRHPGAVEQVEHVSPEPLIVPRIQKAMVLVGPREFPQEGCRGHALQILWSLEHTKVKTDCPSGFTDVGQP